VPHRKTKRKKKVAWKLEDKDWERIKDVFPIKNIGPKGGRPRADNRRVFEALIWFARAGCPWEYMPKNFPSWSTCRRRLLEWEEQGILAAVHQHLLALLDESGKLRMEETFLDGTFVPAKKGAKRSEKQRQERVR
jgi:transposase